MKWFANYSSNTVAGSGNQAACRINEDEPRVARVYYKVFGGGTYGYSLLYTNILDSTFAQGDVCNCNMLCEEWEIVRASAGVCKECSPSQATDPEHVQAITFSGKQSCTVAPGAFVTSDEMPISAKEGEYICVELAFRGSLIPCHPESLLPAFVLEDGKWVPSQSLPFASMVGCNRPVRAKVGFLGDSITQGIGTPLNAYTHWNALCAQALGGNWSWWNLGLGYARAYDAASNGAWLYKAKHLDYAVICLGTNDIGFGRTTEQIIGDLRTIIEKLHDAGVKVLLQTLPPFDWTGEQSEIWLQANRRVREELSAQADAFFDVVPVLLYGSEQHGKARYGGHPNEEGCAKWAEALIPVLREFLTRE